MNRSDDPNLLTGSHRHWAHKWLWVAFFLLQAVFNSLVQQFDRPGVPAWQPWLWEFSSALLILLLIPLVLRFERRWPFRFDSWRRSLPLHVPASMLFCLLHVGGMVLLRKLGYALLGMHYDFGDWPRELVYEYLKDWRTYASIVIVISLYRLWLLRQKGEARLLAAPEEGPPLEPVDRPERFLVRKLGKEFLLAAREIEYLQASGNYVNLRVRGRDYPLRATMAGIEQRLDPARFVRVHRSFLVNLDYLQQIEPQDSGDARLVLRDGGQVPCSRRYRAALRERFGESAAAGA